MLSDVHGNSEALKNVLDHEIQFGFDFIIGLGDYVGYYPYANEVINLLKVYPGVFISGNHDIGVVKKSITNRDLDYRWRTTERELTLENRVWLANLQEELEVESIFGKCVFSHASHLAPDGYLYPDTHINVTSGSRSVYFVGHTHIQMARRVGNSIFVNPGSIGQPRNGRPGSDYAILENGIVTFHHLAYDVDSVAQDIKDWSSSASIELLLRSDPARFSRNPCELQEFSLY